MNRFLLPLIFIFLKFFFLQIFSLTWFLFDPLLVLVVFYSFFHSLDVKAYCGYAIYCGLCADIFSLDIFGIHILSYLGCAFVVAALSVMIYRENHFFVFPAVFLGVFLTNLFGFILKLFVFNTARFCDIGWFFVSSFPQAVGAVIFALPLYKISKRCVLELIG